MSETTDRRRIIAGALLVLAALFISVSAVRAQGEGPGGRIGFFDVLAFPKVWVGALFCAVGLVLLMGSRLTSGVRLAFLPVLFFVFGVLWVLPLGDFARGMGPHPSPLCMVTKPFLFMEAGRSVPIVFPAMVASVLVMSIVGNKLFCGWVCPIGAAQELFHRAPLPERLKTTLPFRFTNAVRVGLVAVFAALIVFAGVSVYDYFNPFDILHWHVTAGILLVLGITLAAAIFIFRPFCYIACPLGLLTWAAEHVSIFKVRLDENACTECDACVEESPCPAVRSILDGKFSRPDCHACGRCIEACPEGAMKFR